MDLIIDLGFLGNESSTLSSINSKVETIINNYSSGYLNNLSGTEISSLASKAKKSVERLKVGHANSLKWLNNYISENNTLEESLAAGKGTGSEQIEFKGQFEDIFSKVTIPAIKTGGDLNINKNMLNSSGVLSYEVGKVPAPGVEAANIQKLDSKSGGRATLLDIKVNGVSLGQDGTITIKKGQQVKLTVQFPEEIEGVQTCKRTNYDGGSNWNMYVSQQNDPMVKKNDPSTYVDTREYNWYITGNQTGEITLSQTALFSLTGNHRYGTYKGMARVRVKIVA